MKPATFALLAFISVPAFTHPIVIPDSYNVDGQDHSVGPRGLVGLFLHGAKAVISSYLNPRSLPDLAVRGFNDESETRDFEDDSAVWDTKEEFGNSDCDDDYLDARGLDHLDLDELN